MENNYDDTHLLDTNVEQNREDNEDEEEEFLNTQTKIQSLKNN